MIADEDWIANRPVHIHVARTIREKGHSTTRGSSRTNRVHHRGRFVAFVEMHPPEERQNSHAIALDASNGRAVAERRRSSETGEVRRGERRSWLAEPIGCFTPSAPQHDHNVVTACTGPLG